MNAAAITFLRGLPWKGIGLAAAILAVLGGVYAKGWHDGSSHEKAAQDARVVAAKAKVVKVEAKAVAITADVGKAVAEKQATGKALTQTLIKENTRYVTVQADAHCDVPAGFVRLHDAAAAGRLPDLPDAAGGADAPTGLALSAVSETVSTNYGECLSWKAVAQGWQDWYARQAANR